MIRCRWFVRSHSIQDFACRIFRVQFRNRLTVLNGRLLWSIFFPSAAISIRRLKYFSVVNFHFDWFFVRKNECVTHSCVVNSKLSSFCSLTIRSIPLELLRQFFVVVFVSSERISLETIFSIEFNDSNDANNIAAFGFELIYIWINWIYYCCRYR